MSNLKDVKIGVLGGGVSPEREISLISAKAAFEALERNNLKPTFIDINTSQREEVRGLLSGKELDLAFIALHGEFGEDGGIQRVVESLNIPYTGSDPEASALAMNKALSKHSFQKAGILTPEFHICCDRSRVPADLTYPLVVKPYRSGSSLGVSIVRSQNELDAAVDLAFSHQDIILIEDYIEGRELTVGILDDQALGVVEIVPSSGYYDFNAKYSDDLTEFIAPAAIPDGIYQDIQAISLAAHKVLGCRHFSRVDLRLDKEMRAHVLEVNSIPGLTSHSLLPLSAKVAQIEFDQLILKMSELALKDRVFIV
ncbi:MAG: D-alanine--D-alanine ligase [Candidatus Omnitrophica bacterium]|nr:D-alanine--D-alanine ligase [Candidatus Omnitrophota bacterium]